jgi:hypothetical protein
MKLEIGNLKLGRTLSQISNFKHPTSNSTFALQIP